MLKIKMLTLVIMTLLDRCQSRLDKRNIIFIMLDDLGWNDVGFHGMTDVPTPNMDALAADAILLNKHYVSPQCTPSRAAFLTGRYPSNIGMQFHVIRSSSPWGLSLKLKILPQFLKELGYATKIIGKWHLGSHKTRYLPTKRGFDYHYGYLSGALDPFNHTVNLWVRKNWTNDYFDSSLCGRDRGDILLSGREMVENLKASWTREGDYLTDILSNRTERVILEHDEEKPLFLYVAQSAIHRGNPYLPIRSPEKYTRHFGKIRDPIRRNYAGVLKAADEAVGRIIRALQSKGMLKNSVVVLCSDNGAPVSTYTENGGSNYPLRGEKFTPWEGGIRTVALIWNPDLNRRGRHRYNQLFHVTDWLPTLLESAGFEGIIPSLDGVSHWKHLGTSGKGPRKEILVDMNPRFNSATYRLGRYKIFYGKPHNHTNIGQMPSHGWSGNPSRNYSWPSQIQNSQVAKALESLYKKKLNLSVPLYEVSCGSRSRRADLMTCEPSKEICLYDVESDPCEFHNIAKFKPRIVKRMLLRLKYFNRVTLRPRFEAITPVGNPRFYGGYHVPWMDPKYQKHFSNLGISRDELCGFNFTIVGL